MRQKSYKSESALFLVPTPIGNLEDITLRAISILKTVEVIFAEDTRETKKLLDHLNISKQLIAAHEHNEDTIKEKMLEYLNNGHSIALVTDRGTPIISDPGYKSVCYIIEKGHTVIGLPGPTALIPALIMSGLPPHPFIFYGFLNSKETKRKKEVEQLKKIPYTLIFYESPHRILSTLKIILSIFGNRKISIAREISKKYEEIYRGNVEDVIEEVKVLKGEIVLVVEGNKDTPTFDNISIIQHVNLYIKEGHTDKEAIKIVAKERSINKSEVYKQYHMGK